MLSPQDAGELLKPFVFLDYLKADIPAGFGFGFHPHSGIATLTYQLDCDVEYEDTAGQKGTVRRGGLEWMQAGGGVWHKGTLTGSSKVTGFQLWVALPAQVEDGPSIGRYVPPEAVPEVGRVRVLLGEYAGERSPIEPPSPMLYLDVTLLPGERWDLDLPSTFDIAWLLPFRGGVDLDGQKITDELAILEFTDSQVSLSSESGCQLMFGAAVRHPYPLVLGHYSVHTNRVSLEEGEGRIKALGDDLKRQGRR
jgi:redox-sensitive bicupin YhaK (pirin superfamily)